jgi:RNA polymerase sigma-70 factor (ECF subfamily)
MPASAAPTISKLLIQARQGDRSALNRLFGACRNYVALLAENQVQSWLKVKVDPSDLVQQTLMEAYHGFARFQGGCEAEWLAWLRGILDHNAADFVRHYCAAGKRALDREVRFDGIAENSTQAFDPPGGAETPVEELIRTERELQLADAIARLDDDQRTVILLRNLQRLPFDAVSQRMGRSRPAVQMLWLRALRKLQSLLSELASSSS